MLKPKSKTDKRKTCSTCLKPKAISQYQIKRGFTKCEACIRHERKTQNS